jgi:RNA polymerase sigma-70 factor (ECF subfamily)
LSHPQLRPQRRPRRPSLRASVPDFEQALEHIAELRATALRYARNERDAEDLVQETLLRALAAWDNFQQGTNCRAWLFRILTNSFINEYRRACKERAWAGRNEPLYSPARRRAAGDPEGALLERLLGDEVVAALAALPDDFRCVVVLADLEGLSYREIATRLACPIGTVMSRLYRARRMLEVSLGEYARELGLTDHAQRAKRRVAAEAA